MTNREIAKTFNLLANIMDLHDENTFKIRSYQNAYNVLRKIGEPLAEMSVDQIKSIAGVGQAIGDKIIELLTTGKMKTLEKYKDMTPIGVQEMIGVRGLGPKKIKSIWKEMGIEDIGSLLYACNENRLVGTKGFGLKTQEDIKRKLEYYADSQGKFLYGFLIDDANDLVTAIKKMYPHIDAALVGGLAKQDPIVNGIEILVSEFEEIDLASLGFEIDEESEEQLYKGYPVSFIEAEMDFAYNELEQTSDNDFFNSLNFEETDFDRVEDFFTSMDLPFIPAYYRSGSETTKEIKLYGIPHFITTEDIKGIVHNHSTYSDGINTLTEMAQACIKLGYEYFVISDHSKSAGYAQGLSVERVEMQWREIEALNEKLKPFKVYKSIESDILSDGSLDYDDEFLKGFDLVIASVHSGLNMDVDRATARLIKAIEHPATRILGHPTGRLLLGRPGYPLHMEKIIDACAANHVVIELNANPQRLDMDYTYIKMAVAKQVKIAINPDAHSVSQIPFVRFGVAVAQKAGLEAADCINTYSKTAFDAWLASK